MSEQIDKLDQVIGSLEQIRLELKSLRDSSYTVQERLSALEVNVNSIVADLAAVKKENKDITSESTKGRWAIMLMLVSNFIVWAASSSWFKGE